MIIFAETASTRCHLIEEEKKKQQSKGWLDLLDHILSDDFSSRFPGLPKCPRNCKIIGMYFEIFLGNNDFHAEKLRIDLLPGWSNSESQIEKAYCCAYEISECIKDMKNRLANPEDYEDEDDDYDEFEDNDEGFDDDAEYGGDEGEVEAEVKADSDSSALSPIEQVKQLKELLDIGALTQEEFDFKKKQLLGL